MSEILPGELLYLDHVTLPRDEAIRLRDPQPRGQRVSMIVQGGKVVSAVLQVAIDGQYTDVRQLSVETQDGKALVHLEADGE